MNKKPTKLRETSGYDELKTQASKIRNKDRHPSQNELPPIDKFHPDWWYYRQEMEEPVEIDDNYKNESRYMNKKLIRLTESDLHRIVKESVNKVLKENTNDDTEIRWGKYERLVDQIRNATQELYMTTSNQYANTPSYDETEGRLHRFAESVLSVLEKFDFVDYGFDPTQHITW